VTLQGILARMRLPAVVGWVLAGLILGPSLLGTAAPLRVPLLALCSTITAMWAGLLVGLGATWAPMRRSWAIPLVTCASSLVTFCVVAIGISLATDLPLDMALILAAVASLWGPVLANFWGRREAQIIGLFGVAFVLVVLSITLGLLVPSGGWDWVARLWLAPVLGAAAAEVLWRVRLLARRGPALLSLTAWTVLATFAAQRFDVPVLLVGLGTGLALAARHGSGRQLEHLLAPVRATTILLFCALLVASADVSRLLWPIPSGLLEILAVQIVALVLIRGVGPALWYPLGPDSEFSRWSGWLLLPRGAVSGTLVLGAGATLPGLLSVGDGELLRAVVLADLLVFCLLFASLAAFIPIPLPARPVISEIGPEQEPKPESYPESEPESRPETN